MAQYNLRMNEQVYQASFKLTKDELEKEVGTFFGSIIGTLNHQLVGDLIWLARFSKYSDRYISLHKIKEYPAPKKLNEIPYPNIDLLYQIRQEIDQIIWDWVNAELDEKDLQFDLKYTNTKNVVSIRNFAELVSHLFNHQTHHRGQVSTLLYQFGYNVGVTDFLIDIPDGA